jgi:hypothetical protein
MYGCSAWLWFYPGSSGIINLLYGSGVVKNELDKKPITHENKDTSCL